MRRPRLSLTVVVLTLIAPAAAPAQPAAISGPVPVVAACTGHAIAMGVFLLMSCDTRVGAAGAFKLGANESITGMRLPVFAVELARDRLSPLHKTRAMIQAFIYDPQGAV